MTVLVELKAQFDEESNIGHGSEKLKKWLQHLYKLCNGLLPGTNEVAPAERVGYYLNGKNDLQSQVSLAGNPTK